MTFTPEDLQEFERLGISPGLLALAGVERVSDADARERFGIRFDGNCSGLVFPYYVNGLRVTARLRRDHPEKDGDGKPQNKYVSAWGDVRHLYLPPDYDQLLSDLRAPILFVEAEKSVLAITEWSRRTGRKVLPIGLGGCWGWRGRVGVKASANGGREEQKGSLPEVAFAKDGRTAGILFDSNARTNRKVKAARKALAAQLNEQGAKVLILDLPKLSGCNGPDDFLSLAGDQAFDDLLNGKAPKEQETTEAPNAITVRPGGIPEATDRADAVLKEHAIELKLFQRDAEVVRLVTLPEVRKSAGLVRPQGSTLTEPMSPIPLLEVLDRLAEWERWDGNPKRPPVRIDCPRKIAESFLSRTGNWGLPVLTGTIFAPLLRDDGTVLDDPGYDEHTGLYLISDGEWPKIPEAPTQDDAQAALGVLLAPFSEFPFCSGEDRATHAAAILTGIQRRMLPTAPLFGYSAPTQRTGKSMLAESVAIIAIGRPAPATATSSDQDEFRKTVTATLYEGHSIVNLDNIEGPLASPFLSMVLTQGVYSDRILGQTKKLNLSTKTMWTATGNNLTFRGDLSVRALVCSIDSACERPEERSFSIPDLPTYLAEHRRELVVAALTILRAYQVAGRPGQGLKNWGGFDVWSESIREPLVWLGLADPGKTRDAIVAEDPDHENAVGLLEALRDEFGDTPFTLNAAISRSGQSTNPLLADTLKIVAENNKGQIDPKKLGWWCRKSEDRIAGGLSLRKTGRKEHHATLWQVVEVRRP